MTTPDNQRQQTRYEVNASIRCENTAAGQMYTLQNISLGGVCLQGDVNENIGTPIELTIHFDDLAQTIVAKGQVIWVNRSNPRDMGVRFLNLREQDLRVLTTYLQQVQTHPEE